MASQGISRHFHRHTQQLRFGFPCPYRYACLAEMVALFIFSSGSFLLDVCKVSHGAQALESDERAASPSKLE